jgi:acyl transferase domain-containing protein
MLQEGITMSIQQSDDASEGLEPIAIIGMACRFPGANNIHEYWENLTKGIETISTFTDKELIDSGVPLELLNDPRYVKSTGALENIEMFDASFFDLTPREADITDPQHRLFLECAWEAMENAGCDFKTCRQRVGIYAGCGFNTYLLKNLLPNSDLIKSMGVDQIIICNDKDFLATKVSYKLGAKGPSINVQSACSTSLVAVCLACQSLQNYQCDIAMAGGVSIRVPQKEGYLHKEGMILSSDGHCRAFDAKANGTVCGNGAGSVVLKRLEDALEDRDYIYGVIRGVAVNNDGSVRVGYTAPGVEGQADAIAEAHAVASVDPESITFIEAHGTGTPIGDPIEIEALTKVFRGRTQKRNFCAIGSVKTNIGHLDAAAGIAGLIKTVLALQHKLIPPTLHFEKPNPRIDFANSPFYVNTSLTEWKIKKFPRRAGVSSFGIGGTNAHAILEEAPPQKVFENQERQWHVLGLSAKSNAALDMATTNLSSYLVKNHDLNLADIAYTLLVGRRAFNHRRALICRDIDDAASQLNTENSSPIYSCRSDQEERPVVFMFPGQGTQYLNMALELYKKEEVFRRQVDISCEILKPHLGLDLRHIIYPDKEAIDFERKIESTHLAQPSLFVIEYALAQLWMEWGVQARAMIGHSLGEYVAACLAGVFSLEDALLLVASRGRMMQRLPNGSMLAVSINEEKIIPFLGKNLSLAAINGQNQCVVSGPTDDIKALQTRLEKNNLDHTPLYTSHAFHSALMDPIIEPFAILVKKIKLNSPKIPYISNASGNWITAAEATDPNYWAQHLRYGVRFSDGLNRLLKIKNCTLLEVGPGRTLSSLAMQHPQKTSEHDVLSSLRHRSDRQSDSQRLLTSVAKLWASGVNIDWNRFFVNERRYRLPLPAYPFQRQRHFIDAPKKSNSNDAGGC